MKTLIDETGRVFKKITVTSRGCMDYIKQKNNQEPKYVSLIGKRFGSFTVVGKEVNSSGSIGCQCDCGHQISFRVYKLFKGIVPECVACRRRKEREIFEKELIGKRFGEFTVIRPLPKRKLWWMWLCRCSCGKEVEVFEGGLLRATSTRCVSCKQRIRGSHNLKDLTGQRFGMLTVISLDGKNKKGKYRWLCRCDCGEENVISSTSLVSGHTRSCGCEVSVGEALLAKYLRDRGIKLAKQKTFDGCVDVRKLRFDFYLPEYGWCIECNGPQHYRPVDCFGGEKQFSNVQRKDKIKSDFCKDNFIPLVKVHYSDYKHLDRVADSIVAFLRR